MIRAYAIKNLHGVFVIIIGERPRKVRYGHHRSPLHLEARAVRKWVAMPQHRLDLTLGKLGHTSLYDTNGINIAILHCTNWFQTGISAENSVHMN